MKQMLKNAAKKVPFIYESGVFLKKAAFKPAEEMEKWKNFVDFKYNYGKILCKNGIKTDKGNLLVVSLLGDSVSSVKWEAILVKAIQLKGFEPVVLTGRGQWLNKYYNIYGVSNFIYWEDYLNNSKKEVDLELVDLLLKGVNSFEDLMNLSYKGVKVGKYISSSLVRMTYTGSVDVKDPETKKQIRAFLCNSILNTIAAEKIYKEYNPKIALFLERGYTPYGEFFDLALLRNINTVQWCGSHKDNGFILKRYNQHNTTMHPASLSSKTWNYLKKLKWNEDNAKIVKQELFHNYKSGKWFSEVGTQFNTQIVKKNDLKKLLNLDPNKKTAVVFSHLFWDATFFYGKDLFANYREWFIETVKAACKNENLNWVLKLHPANVVKLNRDGYMGELVEKLVIKEKIGELPKHIKLLEPQTKISTYSLFESIDYAITVRGTTGIEAALFGRPVFTAGTGRYDRHGFTIDSDSINDYLEKMANIHLYPQLTKDEIELAQKFAYGTFNLKPFVIKSIDISYEKDNVATQKIDFLLKSREELNNAQDIKDFGDWVVNSDDEDYMNPTYLEGEKLNTKH